MPPPNWSSGQSKNPLLCCYNVLCLEDPSIEADVVIIASCIPTLKPLLDRLNGTIKSSRGSSNRYYARYADEGSGHMTPSSRRDKLFDKPKRNSVSITNAMSEESILADHESRNRIRQTHDVCVEYEMQDEFSARDVSIRMADSQV